MRICGSVDRLSTMEYFEKMLHPRDHVSNR